MTTLAIAAIVLYSATISADPYRVDIKKMEEFSRKMHEVAKRRIDPKDLLNARGPGWKLERVKLVEAFGFVDSQLRGLLLVDWRALKAAGIDRSSAVSAQGQNESVDWLLKAILNSAGCDRKGIRYEAVDELIVVSSADRIAAIRKFIIAGRPQEQLDKQAGPLQARIAVASFDFCTPTTRFGLDIGPESFKDALEHLGREANVKIEVVWDALTKRTLLPDIEMDGFIPNVSLACALAVLVCDSDQLEHLRIREEDGRVVLSSD